MAFCYFFLGLGSLGKLCASIKLHSILIKIHKHAMIFFEVFEAEIKIEKNSLELR
jgi:hypothetical protein